MTTTRPPVSLGDGVRALRTLRPTDERTAEDILAVLGLRVRQPARPPPVEPSPGVLLPAEAEAPPPRIVEPEPLPEPDELPPLGKAVPSSLDVHRSTGAKALEDVTELPKGEADRLPPIEPLFLPRWIRGILSAALSVSLRDGTPDVDRIVEAVARGEAITEVPRRPAPTMRLGVQLLVDHSARMAPFAKDLAWLEWAVQRVVGDDRVELHRFTGVPGRAGVSVTGAPGTTYRPPVAGTPVLVLTDLGIGRPMFDAHWSDPDEWLVFADGVQRAGCPLIAFVPYPPSRWPRTLARALTAIQLDRTTSAATVRGRMGSAAV